MPRIVPATTLTANAPSIPAGGVGCAEHGDGPMNDHDDRKDRVWDELIAMYGEGEDTDWPYLTDLCDWIVEQIEQELQVASRSVTSTEDNESDLPTPAMQRMDLRVIRLKGEAMEWRERAEQAEAALAVAGSATPTGDDDE